MGATFIKAPSHAFSAPAVLAKLIKANDDGGENDDNAAAAAAAAENYDDGCC